MRCVVSPSDRWLRRRQNAAATAALVLWVAAAIGLGPALIGCLRLDQREPAYSAPTWALLTVWLAAIQCAYGLLMLQFPDRSAARVAAFSSLLLAAAYAATFAVACFGGEENDVAGFLELDQVGVRRQVVLWCLTMTCVSAGTSLICGRAGLRLRTLEATPPCGESYRY